MAAKTDWAWFAGILDGEGWIRIGTDFVLVIAVANTDSGIVDRCREITGEGKIHCRAPHNGGKRPLYTWSCFGGAAQDVIRMALPFMIEAEKRRKAVLALTYPCNPKGLTGEHAHLSEPARAERRRIRKEMGTCRQDA